MLGSSFIVNVRTAFETSPTSTTKDAIIDTPFRKETTKTNKEDEESSYMLSCLNQVLHNELPISNKQRKMKNQCPGCHVVFAHHWDAGNKHLWNPAVDYRLKPMKVLDDGPSNCSIWEVGAHTKADDSKQLQRLYKQCQYHAFEPIPIYSTQLKQHWNNNPTMTVHEYGIGKVDTTFTVSHISLQGQATYLGSDTKKTANNQGDLTAQIKSFDYAIKDADGIPTVLHMNCEGCEWDFLTDAKEHGFLNSVPVVQIGWHNYGDETHGLGPRTWRLCQLRYMLSQTHNLTNGLAFGWDRWELLST
jgi:FkbM family methyltransferase